MDLPTSQFICPHCQGVFEAAAAESPQTVSCPHCGNATIIQMAPQVAAAESLPSRPGAPLPQPPRRRQRRTHLLGWAVVLLCLTAGAGAYLFMGGFPRPNRQPQTTDDAASNKANERATPSNSTEAEHWTDAADRSLQLSGFDVKVVRAELGPVVGRDQDKSVQTLAPEGLQIGMEIRNVDRNSNRFYHSWYEASREGESFVTLTDSRGTAYPLLYFRDIRQLRGHTAEAELVPSQRVRDILIFEVPASVDRNRITHFHLELRGTPLEISGRLRFRVPVSMVHNWQ